MKSFDAVVIGGGFYGAVIALYLKKERGLNDVLLIEKEQELLSRASFRNQARVHNGYHYPRSLTTALRSRINFPKFVRAWPNSIYKTFTKIYAVARNSKVTAHQFERFCREIGAPVKKAESIERALFDPRLIEDAFLVEEYAFDSTEIRRQLIQDLVSNNIEVRLHTTARDILSSGRLAVVLEKGESVQARYVFNCAYSSINQFKGAFSGVATNLKHEITELALVQLPSELKYMGVTLIDGPFFSVMPFPARTGLHTLSHVRYTPHLHWYESAHQSPYEKLDGYQKVTRFDRMIRDSARYMPSILRAKYVESLFEVKTVLVKNEVDDGRPILFEKCASLPGFYSILGGKIDNVFDILEMLSGENFVALPRELEL